MDKEQSDAWFKKYSDYDPATYKSNLKIDLDNEWSRLAPDPVLFKPSSGNRQTSLDYDQYKEADKV